MCPGLNREEGDLAALNAGRYENRQNTTTSVRMQKKMFHPQAVDKQMPHLRRKRLSNPRLDGTHNLTTKGGKPVSTGGEYHNNRLARQQCNRQALKNPAPPQQKIHPPAWTMDGAHRELKKDLACELKELFQSATARVHRTKLKKNAKEVGGTAGLL